MLECIQRRVVKGCEERLSMPGLSSLEEGRLRSNLTSLCSWGSAEGGLFPAQQQWDAWEQHRDVLGMQGMEHQAKFLC